MNARNMRDTSVLACGSACAIAVALASGCYTGLSGGAAEGMDGEGSADAGADDDGSSGTIPDGPGDDVPPPVDRIGMSGLRRLSVREYADTMRDLLHEESIDGLNQLPTETLTPFDNDYRDQVASLALIDAVDFLAARASERLLSDPPRYAEIVGCVATGPDDEACMRDFVTRFGRRALRRPLTEAEIDDYLHGPTGNDGALDHAIEAGAFEVGVDTILRTMLQEPEFLYRVEFGTPVAGEPGLFELSQFEVATRLSYLVWGSTPDDALLDRAADGALGDSAGLRAAALDMLTDPRAVERVARFHAMWLGYAVLPHPAALSSAMQAETTALVERVVFADKRPWQDLFRFPQTFVSDMLAEHYGLPLPGSDEPVWVDYGESGRQGILSHGSFLSIGAKFEDTSPVLRGKFVRERLFCQPLQPKPMGVDVDQPVAPEGTVCKVDRFAAHREGACAGCHALMDPVGFGLENYDQLGRYREYEADNPMTEADESQCAIEGSGEIVGVGTFHGPAELARLALDNGLLEQCVTTQLVRLSAGHSELDDFDQQFVALLLERIATGDFRFDELVIELVSDEAFRYRREEEA
ncbi:MAG TPA: DUF1592 domain-containing protein [Nannocystaceae bacterium]|nr:DUF1592 domain-containing protein [Nannocystaceae bacterium]